MSSPPPSPPSKPRPLKRKAIIPQYEEEEEEEEECPFKMWPKGTLCLQPPSVPSLAGTTDQPPSFELSQLVTIDLASQPSLMTAAIPTNLSANVTSFDNQPVT